MNSRKGKTDSMIKYIPLLLWILFLYFMSWFYTSVRNESVLITVSKSLNKILFFINSSHGISIVSIIIGLFAHFSLMVFVVLLFFNNFVQLYVEYVLELWWLSGLSLLCVGEIIETYIKFKRAETQKKKRVFLYTMILLIFSVVFLFCITVIYGLGLCLLVFE